MGFSIRSIFLTSLPRTPKRSIQHVARLLESSHEQQTLQTALSEHGISSASPKNLQQAYGMMQYILASMAPANPQQQPQRKLCPPASEPPLPSVTPTIARVTSATQEEYTRYLLNPTAPGSTQTKKQHYRCILCGRDARQRSTLITQGRMHTGEKPSACSLCGHQGTLMQYRIIKQKTRPQG